MTTDVGGSACFRLATLEHVQTEAAPTPVQAVPRPLTREEKAVAAKSIVYTLSLLALALVLLATVMYAYRIFNRSRSAPAKRSRRRLLSAWDEAGRRMPVPPREDEPNQ